MRKLSACFDTADTFDFCFGRLTVIMSKCNLSVQIQAKYKLVHKCSLDNWLKYIFMKFNQVQWKMKYLRNVSYFQQFRCNFLFAVEYQ